MAAVNSLPLVSIVTPSYNQAAFLNATIRSVLDQDYPNLEYIIIDGGSTDESVNIIRRYQARLAYWVSERDAGQADAINKGWQRARGEIVAYLNSDDTYEPGAVRAAVEYLMQHPDSALVYGHCYQINEAGERVGMLRAIPVDVRALLLRNSIMQPTVFLRRAVLEQVGMLDLTLGYSLDYDLWLRVAQHHHIGALPKPLANFRAHDASKSFAQPLAFIRDREKILTRFFANPQLDPALQPLYERAMLNSYLTTILICFALGQNSDGTALWTEMVARYPNFAAHTDELVEFVANAAVHNAATPWLNQTTRDPQVWTNELLTALPPSAEPLRRLAPQIAGHIHTIRAFQAYWQRDYAVTRTQVLRAWRADPRTLLNRGLVSIWLETFVGKNFMSRWRRTRAHSSLETAQ